MRLTSSYLSAIAGKSVYTASQTGQGTLLSFASGDTILLSNVFDFEV